MPKRSLDAIDRKILEHLQADGRMSLNDLAAKVGLSPSPCLRRVRMLERDGVISRYVAVLDQRVVVPDLEAYERFVKQKLTRVEGIASIESSFALEQVKYTNVLPLP